MNKIDEKIKLYGIMPIITIENVEDAVPIAKALVEGGLPIAEVTFRTKCAKEAIKEITKAFPDMLMGAGTVLTKEQVDQSIEAGAKFIVTPGINPNIVKYCTEKNIPIYPGCATPSDVDLAQELGLNVVKFFPSEQLGGIGYIKAIAAPFVNMSFIATGGVNEKNINDYLAFDKVIACGGSFMVNKDLIVNKEFDKITELTKITINTMLGFEVAHIGINTNNETEAIKTSKSFKDLFGFEETIGNSSIFASKGIEVLKSKYLGEKGHIGIKTNSIERAVAYLKEQGYEFLEDSIKYDKKNKLMAIYLKNEISGFAIHLVQK